MMEWCNQVAVVTGGARGLGRATARLLAHRGAAVCVNYSVHADAAEARVAENVTASGRAIAMAADVEEQIEYASDILSLEAADIFVCGTCGGVGQGTTRSSTLAT
jgi:NAD(P)-dependent dehydrogenase (short-subunit alcohol dehydrogenase family)